MKRILNDIAQVKWNERGLAPAIAQCSETREVLMLAWMNKESLAITLETGRVTYYSRSRDALWEKGATSGNTQKLITAMLDCDGDTILLEVAQKGVACHEGVRSCFDDNNAKTDT